MERPQPLLESGRPDPGEEAALVQSFLKYGTIYVVADPDTTIEEWTEWNDPNLCSNRGPSTQPHLADDSLVGVLSN